MKRLIIATRGSKLALAQANLVARALAERNPGLAAELAIIKTKGDKILDVPLAKVGGKGLFVKEIEDALLEGRAQLAVHSMKDMPAELPDGLILASVTQRADPRDVFISRAGTPLADLPQGARIGTSSLRRQAQLWALRPDFEMVPLRGNVETRLRKMGEQELDGVILAAAGLERLGLDNLSPQPLEPSLMLPAVGQGALGLEARVDDQETLALVRALNHELTAQAVAAERAFLARLMGGCQVPIAGHATVEGGKVKFQGLVAALDGSRVIRAGGESTPQGAAAMGATAAEEVLAQGGGEILAQVYGETE